MHLKDKKTMMPLKNKMSLFIMTSGKLFGFNDVSHGLTTYSESVTCISSGSCYKIKAEELLHFYHKSE